MKKLIYRKSDLTFVGTVQNNTTLEWELKNNVIPNFGGVNEDYSVIETEIEKPRLIDNNGVIEVQERPKTNDEIKQEILTELSELDKIITRQNEQVYIDTNVTPSYQPMVEAVARKTELRNQLKNL